MVFYVIYVASVCALAYIIFTQRVNCYGDMSLWSFLIFFINSWSGNFYMLLAIFAVTFNSAILDVVLCFVALTLANTSCLIFTKHNNFYRFFSKNEIILKLVDGLIELHPVLFYISLCTLVLAISVCIAAPTSKFRYAYRWRWHVLLLSLTALISGGFWSFSQTTWDSWWTWDPIELILLIIVFTTVLLAHCHIYLLRRYFFLFFYGLILCVCSTLMIRLGLTKSRHSFLADFEKTIEGVDYELSCVGMLPGRLNLLALAIATAPISTFCKLYKFLCFFPMFCVYPYSAPDFIDLFDPVKNTPITFDFLINIFLFYVVLNINIFLFVLALIFNFLSGCRANGSFYFFFHKVCAYTLILFLIYQDTEHTLLALKTPVDTFKTITITAYNFIATINSNFCVFFAYLNETATLHIRDDDVAYETKPLRFPSLLLGDNNLFFLWFMSSQLMVSNCAITTHDFTSWWAGLLDPFLHSQAYSFLAATEGILDFVHIDNNMFAYRFFNRIELQNDPVIACPPVARLDVLASVRFAQPNKAASAFALGTLTTPYIFLFPPFTENFKSPARILVDECTSNCLQIYYLFDYPDPDENIVDFIDYIDYQKTLCSNKTFTSANSARKTSRNVDSEAYYNSSGRVYATCTFIFFLFICVLCLLYVCC